MSEYTTLVAGDGSKFVIPVEAARRSATVRAALDNALLGKTAPEGDGEGDTETGPEVTCTQLPTISGIVLEKASEYAVCAAAGSGAPERFVLPTELALEVLVAADYLQL